MRRFADHYVRGLGMSAPNNALVTRGYQQRVEREPPVAALEMALARGLHGAAETDELEDR